MKSHRRIRGWAQLRVRSFFYRDRKCKSAGCFRTPPTIAPPPPRPGPKPYTAGRSPARYGPTIAQRIGVANRSVLIIVVIKIIIIVVIKIIVIVEKNGVVLLITTTDPADTAYIFDEGVFH